MITFKKETPHILLSLLNFIFSFHFFQLSKVSCGILNTRKIELQKIIPNTVITIDNSKENIIPVSISFFTLSNSFFPMHFDTNILVPIVIPIDRITNRELI